MLTRTYWRTVALAACGALALNDITDIWWLQATIVVGCVFGALALDAYLQRLDKRYHERQMRQLIAFLRPRTFEAKPESFEVVMKVQEILDQTDVRQRPVPMSEFMLNQLRVMATDFNDDPAYNPLWRPR